MKQNDNPFEPVTVLDQSNGKTPIQRHLKLALLFGATPLVVGVAIYVYWRITGMPMPWFIGAGVATFFAGMISFLLGLIAWWKARSGLKKIPVSERGGSAGLISLALVLLMANWPVAFWLAGDALGSGKATEVTIQNSTTTPLTDVTFSWASTQGDLGTINAGSNASKRCRVSFFHCSAIYINYERGDVKSEIRVSPMWRESPLDPVTVTIGDDDTIQSSDVRVEDHRLTQHTNIDADGHDKIVFDFGRTGTNWVGVERVTAGRTKWIKYADQLDTSHDTYIQNARVSIEDDEFHLYCEGQAGKYHERRKLDTGELIERSEELTLVPESIDDKSE